MRSETREIPALILLSLIAFTIAFIGAFVMRMVTVQSINDQCVYYNVGKPFVESLLYPSRW